jgi:predicted nucleotidyltransferase component of viral defense system
LDFSFREEVFLKPAVKSIGRFLEEIPSFDVYVMDLEEIFAEKIRTIFARNKARDVYDFYFLINQRVKLNIELINKKLKYYNKKFSKKELFDSLKEKESIWNSELSGLVNNVPDFDLVMKEVRRFFLENKKGKRR